MDTTNILKYLLASLLLLGLLTGCNEDPDLEPDATENVIQPGESFMGSNTQGPGGSDFDPCFDPVFPVTITMPDGAQIVGTAHEQIEEEIEAWYEANPDVEEEPSIVFPITIVFEDGTEQVVDNMETLEELAEDCEDHEDEYDCEDELEIFDCYELVFPVTVTMPDGTQITGSDEDNLFEQGDAWYEANPDAEEDPEFVYPITLIDEEGTETVVNSDEELEVLEEDCEDYEHGDECFTLVFPASFTLPDGTQHTVANEDEALEIIDAFYEANPDEEDEPELVFPVTIQFDDGTTAEIDSEDALEEAEEDC